MKVDSTTKGLLLLIAAILSVNVGLQVWQARPHMQPVSNQQPANHTAIGLPAYGVLLHNNTANHFVTVRPHGQEIIVWKVDATGNYSGISYTANAYTAGLAEELAAFDAFTDQNAAKSPPVDLDQLDKQSAAQSKRSTLDAIFDVDLRTSSTVPAAADR